MLSLRKRDKDAARTSVQRDINFLEKIASYVTHIKPKDVRKVDSNHLRVSIDSNGVTLNLDSLLSNNTVTKQVDTNR